MVVKKKKRENKKKSENEIILQTNNSLIHAVSQYLVKYALNTVDDDRTYEYTSWASFRLMILNYTISIKAVRLIGSFG